MDNEPNNPLVPQHVIGYQAGTTGTVKTYPDIHVKIGYDGNVRTDLFAQAKVAGLPVN